MTDDSDAREGDVIAKGEDSESLEGIAQILEGVVTPFAKSQDVAQKEATERTKIFAGIASKLIVALVIISVFVFTLAGISMFYDNGDLAEKIVIGFFAFLGGIGTGRSFPK
jgi:hypothetical protein